MSRDPQPSLSQEAELERLIWEMIDALGTIDGVAMNDWGAGDPEFVKARSALLEYLADRTLTEREAAALVDQSEYRTLPMDQIGDWQVAMSKLRRLSSPPATREEEVK